MSSLTPSQSRALALHRQLDLVARTDPRPFVSGWETSHDVEYSHLADAGRSAAPSSEYTFMADDEALHAKIRDFHLAVDGTFAPGSGIFAGAGSSPLLTATVIALREAGATEICYVPPIYHAYYQLGHLFGLAMTALGDGMSAAGEAVALERLPSRRTVLLVTDPNWISGRPMSRGFVEEIRRWQERTESTVIVDGTFSYTGWGSLTGELASGLVAEQTIRLVCPTKSLCVHGVRCAYLILPETLQEDLGWYYCKIVAATSQHDVAAAHLLIDQLVSEQNNRPLTDLARQRFRALVDLGLLTDVVAEPSCTYYSFGRLRVPEGIFIGMSPEYFELDYPSDLLRVNLLSSAVRQLVGTPEVATR